MLQHLLVVLILQFRCIGSPLEMVRDSLISVLASSSNGTILNTFPIHRASNESRVRNRYIVKLKDDVSQEIVDKVNEVLKLLNGTIVHQYQEVFKGFAFSLPGDLPVDALQQLPWIDYISEDSAIVSYQVQQTDSYLWNLDQIDRSRGMPGSYTFNTTGDGVNVYIVDSAVDAGHSEFRGRMREFYTSPTASRNCRDHGTHVGGIIGGLNVGVAKKVNLFSLNVLGCSEGSTSEVNAALEYIIKNHKKPAVINMSIGPKDRTQPLDPGLQYGIQQATAAGITVFLAMGNFGSEACGGATSAPGALSVGSVDETLARSSFSNFGKCSFIWAPGSNIASAKAGGGYAIKSGTSQATPLVAGLAAILLEQNPTSTPQQVAAAIRQAALKDVVKDTRTSPNFLLQSVIIPDRGSSEANRQLVSLDRPDTVKRFLEKTDFYNNLMYAGIGVSIAVIIGLLLCYWRYRRSRGRQGPAPELKHKLLLESVFVVPKPEKTSPIEGRNAHQQRLLGFNKRQTLVQPPRVPPKSMARRETSAKRMRDDASITLGSDSVSPVKKAPRNLVDPRSLLDISSPPPKRNPRLH